MHKPWLYHITGISGYQVVAQRVERHGRSREIRNAHVLARCGMLEVGNLAFLPDKPVYTALAILGIILDATAAYAACDSPPSRGRKRKTGMSDLTLVLILASKKSRDEALKCKGCAKTGVVPRKGEWRRIRCHDIGRMRCPKCGRLFKEKLRSIYANAKTKLDAAGLFKDWIEEARATKVDDLVARTSTMEDHLAGILGFWEFRGASNASVEGFNNKIRWLIRQAYGYRDFKYFRLKVFDLPNLKPRSGDR